MDWDGADSFVVVLMGHDARPLAMHGPFMDHASASSFVATRVLGRYQIWPLHSVLTRAS